MSKMMPPHSQTMGDVEATIADKSKAIARHDFLARLATGASSVELLGILPRFSFFVFGFQDVLRIAHARATHPELKDILRSMVEGDSGHDRWYLEDLRALGIELPLELVFSRELAVGRDVAYTLIASILEAKEDYSRLSLILCLEAVAREFFLRVPAFAKRAGISQGLRYFGGEHLLAEKAHEVFEDTAQQALARMVIPDHARLPVEHVIEKTFASMTLFADDLFEAMLAAANSSAPIDGMTSGTP